MVKREGSKMRRIELAFLFLAFAINAGKSQWENLSNPNLGYITTCKFVSATKGWLINLSNTPPQGLMRTTDGGVTWAKVLDHPPGVFNWLNDFDFLNDSLGYVEALNGQRFRTFNGGDTWDTLRNSLTDNLHGGDDNRPIKIFSPRLAYSFGFIRSVDTFRTWQQIGTLPPNSSAYYAFYLNADTIILAGGAETVIGEWTGTMECYRSIDSGFTWQQTFFDSMWAVRALAFGDWRIGYAFSELHNDTVARVVTLKTTNGGRTWLPIPARLAGSEGLGVQDAFFQNPVVGFVCGNGVASTVDGGMTWTRVPGFPTSFFSSMSWPDSLHGWIVGHGGKVYRTTNGGGLPIVLASFTARHLGGTRVRLDWRTLSETNNYGFFVQRRRQTDSTFTEISSLIPGYGTTNEPHDYSWTDSNATINRWYYRLKQVDLGGPIRFTEPIVVDVTTNVGEVKSPFEFRLVQNYPNPFNPSTRIAYSVQGSGFTSLKVFDVLGREVATLVNEEKQPGEYSVTFDASNLSSGVYVYKLQAGGFTASKKMIVMR
jgi:photosystem II stability/assembly factor-like uncharacterized protein